MSTRCRHVYDFIGRKYSKINQVALIGTFIFIIVKTLGLMTVFKVNIDNMGEAESPSKIGQKFLEPPWIIC